MGKLFIISAPSGAGKTSLVKRAISEIAELKVSISHTTRPMRMGETEGKDYFFTSVAEFESLLEQGAFLEHARVFDNYYGTLKTTVEGFLERGQDVILEIDWQGAQQIKRWLSDSVSIFILPPSVDVLRDRLNRRGSDSKDIIERRMAAAINEMQHFAEFDYLIVNDNFESALNELKSIITASRLETKRQSNRHANLIKDLIK